MQNSVIQAAVRYLTGNAGQFNEDLHALADMLAIPPGTAEARLAAVLSLPPANVYAALGECGDGVFEGMVAGAVLKKYGASLILPGDGVNNGFNTGNYTDSTGTTPATIDGLVGLALDAANGALGQKLVSGGDMSSTSGWTVSGTGASLVSDGSVGTLTAGSTTSYFQRNCPTVVDRLYRITVVLPASIGSGAGRVRIGGTTLSPDLVAGENVRYFAATSTTTAIGVTATGAAGTTVMVDDISVREVIGIHASQVTQGYKPYLRRNATTGKYYWQFDGVDDQLVLGSVPFQMSDDYFIVVGARCMPVQPSWNTLFASSGSGDVARIQLAVDGASGAAIFYCRGDAGVSQSLRLYNADYRGKDAVFTAVRRSGIKKLGVNGSVVYEPDVSVGAATLTGSALSKLAYGADYFLGDYYCVIYGKGPITDAELLLLERFAASCQGRQL